MTLNIIGIDEDPDRVRPTRQNLLQAAQACSLTATTKSQLLLKIDALRGILPVKKTRWLDFLRFKLLDSIRDDAVQLMRDAKFSDQFWTTAGDVLIEIVKVHPKIGQAAYAVIDTGGDIEIAAHNQAGRITVTLVEPSGLRHIVFDGKRQPGLPVNHRRGHPRLALTSLP